jgi:hypothetical protein
MNISTSAPESILIHAVMHKSPSKVSYKITNFGIVGIILYKITYFIIRIIFFHLDYRFLEEASRVADNARRDHKNKQKFFSRNVRIMLNTILNMLVHAWNTYYLFSIYSISPFFVYMAVTKNIACNSRDHGL